jgi:hypothetical protein
VEFSSDNKYLLAADGDFSPFRARVTVAGGAEFNAAEATDTMSFIADLPGRELGPRWLAVDVLGGPGAR